MNTIAKICHAWALLEYTTCGKPVHATIPITDDWDKVTCEKCLVMKKIVMNTDVICKGCKEPIAGFNTNGYCEDCLCQDCGTELTTENERTMGICEECEND